VADPDKRNTSLLPDDDEARADAIEERIERLRRAAGLASEAAPAPEEKSAIAEAAEGAVNRSKASNSKIILRWGD